MTRFRWWLSDVLLRLSLKIEPRVKPIDVAVLVTNYMKTEDFWDMVRENNALMRRLTPDH